MLLVISFLIFWYVQYNFNEDDIIKSTYSVTILGDVTGDGTVEINDVSRLYRTYKGVLTLSKIEKITGDVVEDNEIKINDVSKLYRYVKGIQIDKNIGGNLDSKYFLNTAKKVWNWVVLGDRKFKYQEVNNNPIQIPITGSGCNCSAYVSWVLYEFGYTDFKGDQLRTNHFYKTDWNKKYGWTEIKFKKGANITSQLKPGDIVVRVSESTGYGHINIVATNGGTYSYDCGNSSRVKNGAYPNGIQDVAWYKSGNPGKIIRPTIPK